MILDIIYFLFSSSLVFLPLGYLVYHLTKIYTTEQNKVLTNQFIKNNGEFSQKAAQEYRGYLQILDNYLKDNQHLVGVFYSYGKILQYYMINFIIENKLPYYHNNESFDSYANFMKLREKFGFNLFHLNNMTTAAKNTQNYLHFEYNKKVFFTNYGYLNFIRWSEHCGLLNSVIESIYQYIRNFYKPEENRFLYHRNIMNEFEIHDIEELFNDLKTFYTGSKIFQNFEDMTSSASEISDSESKENINNEDSNVEGNVHSDSNSESKSDVENCCNQECNNCTDCPVKNNAEKLIKSVEDEIDFETEKLLKNGDPTAVSIVNNIAKVLEISNYLKDDFHPQSEDSSTDSEDSIQKISKNDILENKAKLE